MAVQHQRRTASRSPDDSHDGRAAEVLSQNMNLKSMVAQPAGAPGSELSFTPRSGGESRVYGVDRNEILQQGERVEVICCGWTEHTANLPA
jgi:hypothetical protein